MNTVEPMMGFWTFIVLFVGGLWAGGALEHLYRGHQRRKAERRALLQRSIKGKDAQG